MLKKVLILILGALLNNLYAQLKYDTTFYSDSKSISQIIEREGTKKTHTTFYENGQRNEQYITIDDTMEGDYKYWIQNGTLTKELHYKHGQLSGTCKYWQSNGIIAAEENFEVVLTNNAYKSFKNGLQLSYFDNGQLRSKTSYLRGKKHGEEHIWDETGTKILYAEYADGYLFGRYESWFKTGKPKYKGEYDTLVRVNAATKIKSSVAEVSHKLCKTYFITGKVNTEIYYNRGVKDGKSISWYQNGNKKSEETYKGGLLIGKYYTWREGDPQQWNEKSYLTKECNYIIVYDSLSKTYESKLHGVFKTYSINKNETTEMSNYKLGFRDGKSYKYVNNKVVFESNYNVQGYLINTIEYYPSGSKFQEKNFKPHSPIKSRTRESLLEGKTITYYEKGAIKISGQYHSGQKTGTWVFYHPNGIVNTKYNYVNDQKKGFQYQYFENGKPRDEEYCSEIGEVKIVKRYNENGILLIDSDIYVDSSSGSKKVEVIPSRFYDENGVLRKKTTTYKGKIIGPYWEKDESGQLIKEGYCFNYNNPKIEWVATYSSNGQLIKEALLYNNQELGDIIEWYKSGTIKSIYKSGDYNITWLPGGNVLSTYFTNAELFPKAKDTVLNPTKIREFYDSLSKSPQKAICLELCKDTKKQTSYFAENVPKFDTYLNSKEFDLKFSGYYRDGRPLVGFELKNGIPHGKFQIFNGNQTIQNSGEFKAGKPVGVWIYNSGSGIPMEEFEYDTNSMSAEYPYLYRKEYLNGKLFNWNHYKNGKLNGIQYSYRQSGELNEKYNMSNGKLQGRSEEYYSNGNLKKRKEYDSLGIQTGLYEEWFESGSQKAEIVYKDGAANGKCTLWHKNGFVAQKGFYKNDKADSLWIISSEKGKKDTLVYKGGLQVGQRSPVQCECQEQNPEQKYLTPALVDRVDTSRIDLWQYKFHESIKRYIDDCYYTNDHDENLRIITFRPMEVGIPNKDGLKLLINPCLSNSYHKIEVATYIEKHNPDDSRYTFQPHRLAYRYDRRILKPVDSTIAETKAYFDVENISYSSKGIEFVKPKNFCFQASRIGNTPIKMELTKFRPIAYGEFEQNRYNYDAESMSESTNTQPGLIKGAGFIYIPIDNLVQKLPFTNVEIIKDLLMGTIVIENIGFKGDTYTISTPEGALHSSKEALEKYFEQMGFKVSFYKGKSTLSIGLKYKAQ